MNRKRPKTSALRKARDILAQNDDEEIKEVGRWLYRHIIDLEDRARAKKAGISVSYLRKVLYAEGGRRD